MTRTDNPNATPHPPQHILDEHALPPGGDVDRNAWKHRPTGADPHPSDDEHYQRIAHPGGAHPLNEDRDIGPNSAVHDGTPKPRPRNAETT